MICVMPQVLMSSWTDLASGIKSSASLMDVRIRHEHYVNAATKCCFLDDAGREVMLLRIHFAHMNTFADLV